MKNNRDTNDEFEGEYIGNMWGWRFSYFSLGLILLFSILIGIRYCQTGEFPHPDRAEPIESVQKDSLQ